MGPTPADECDEMGVRMGRIVVFLLLLILVVPALLLGRLWRQATQRRLVNEGTLSFVVPTAEAEATMARWPLRARVLRAVGLVAGLALIVALAVRIGTVSVFLWPLALALGYLLGVLAGELLRPRPQWELDQGRSGGLADYINAGLVWSLRATALLGAATAVGTMVLRTRTPDGSAGPQPSCPGGWAQLVGTGQVTPYAVLVLGVGVASWLVTELILLRTVRLPRAADLDDVPLDEALRSASAHAAVAAGSILTLLPLGGFALVSGIAVVGSCANSDVVSISLIAGGLAALLAGVFVAAFLPSWLRPVRRRADVRS